jgi:hypothetical protein
MKQEAYGYELIENLTAKEVWIGTKDYISWIDNWPHLRKSFDEQNLQTDIVVGIWLDAASDYVIFSRRT